MTAGFVPQVAVVDFNHHSGPEIELWADPVGEALCEANAWSQLPFLALPDGAHASSEEFSYFTLVSQGNTQTNSASTSLFGVACTRQIRADRLKVKSAEVTRSFVQKAVIIIADKPGALGTLRERLATITAAWFAQENFTDTEILKEFQLTLQREASVKREEADAYFGLSLRELLHDLRHQTLVLFKCLLLQKRMLFFGTRCERLCMTQFALVSLIPHLLESLQDCASAELNTYEKSVNRATNLRTSERSSLLAYVGLPLQIFGLNAFFSPYTPLQQLDLLAAPSSASYVAGSTNTLFLAQRDYPDATNRYVDVLVNLDDPPNSRITILDPTLRSALSLSAADRRWIDNLTQTVVDTWNPADPSRPNTHGYQGSEEAIRLNFEEYILSLLSTSAYKNHFDNHPNSCLSSTVGGASDERYPDPNETVNDFNNDFLAIWRQTPNYKLWYSLTSESSIFDIVEPRHPTAGGLNIEDVQRRVGAAVADLNLDEKVRQGREQAGKALEAGREKVGLGVARLWKEVESFKERREQSRARSGMRNDQKENVRPEGDAVGNEPVDHDVVFDASRPPTGGATVPVPIPSSGPVTTMISPATIDITTTTTVTTNPNLSTPAMPSGGGGSGGSGGGSWSSWRTRASEIPRPAVDTTQIQAAARENAVRAGAYLSSWGSWARDKSRDWQESRGSSPASVRETGGPMSPNASVGAGAGAAAAMRVGRTGSVGGIGSATVNAAGEPSVGIQRVGSVGAVGAARSAMGSGLGTSTGSSTAGK